jgi:RHS repeat-associated protein
VGLCCRTPYQSDRPAHQNHADEANRLVNVGGVAQTWDNNGNLLNDGVYTYTYDTANRLVGASGQSSVNSYQYNGMGDRLRQVAGGITTTYTLDLNAGLTQVLADVANGATNTYLYGNGRIAQQGLTTDYFLTDALGSVRQLTNSTGQVTLAKSYQPYGSVMSSAGTASSIYGFAGEQTDPYTELLFLNARYYDPALGRFISADSIVPQASNPQALNRYSYAYNSPLNYIDPSGHDPCTGAPGTYQPDCGVDNTPAPFLIPSGSYWRRLAGTYGFSAYDIVWESEYKGAMVDIPGVPGLQAKADFLYNKDAVGMQGTGMILRDGQQIYIHRDAGYWTDSSGQRVYSTSKGWVYEDKRPVEDPDTITLTNARFSRLPARPPLSTRYSVAAPKDFAKGTLLYAPSLGPYTPNAGVLIIQDRGGAFPAGEHRFDVFAGDTNCTGSRWWVEVPSSARVGVPVYELVLPLEVYSDRR